MPVALGEALEARRVFERRGLARLSLLDARRAWLSGLQVLPADLSLHGALVVDVGANEGAFVNAVLRLAPSARVIAVEPTPLPLGRLRERFARSPNVTIVAKAVAEGAGTARMNIAPYHTGSSLLRPRAGMDAMYGSDGDWRVAEELEVPTVSLDELVGGDEVAVVKIDVQGAEMGVLAGGRETLRRTRAILIEVVFVSHYEGDTPFPLLNRRLEELGFELRGISDPHRLADGTTMWADACFVRCDGADAGAG